MREFFGFGGYERPAEGYLSWQHLLFVTLLMVIMVLAAIFLGRRNKSLSEKEKNRVLIVAAIAIDSLELFRIVLLCFRAENPMEWIYMLPFFLCSIQLVTLPLAAFSSGRVKEAALDFVFVFGVLGAVLGTYAAGNNYAAYPVLSYDNVHSGLTHAISGFSSLYILISGMASMKRKNIASTISIVTGVCIVSYIAARLTDYNYMFLLRGDGTPYDIVYNLVSGNPVLYPILVTVLFYLYIAAFYGVYYLIKSKIIKKEAPSE